MIINLGIVETGDWITSQRRFSHRAKYSVNAKCLRKMNCRAKVKRVRNENNCSKWQFDSQFLCTWYSGLTATLRTSRIGSYWRNFNQFLKPIVRVANLVDSSPKRKPSEIFRRGRFRNENDISH